MNGDFVCLLTEAFGRLEDGSGTIHRDDLSCWVEGLCETTSSLCSESETVQKVRLFPNMWIQNQLVHLDQSMFDAGKQTGSRALRQPHR